MVKLAPSILSADFGDLRGQIAAVEAAGADWLHLDVMDGHFVPNISFGPPLIRSIRRLTRIPFDTHLMIRNADAFLEDFRKAGADVITVHVEACTHVQRTVTRIRELGALAGVSISPSTPVASLRDIIPLVDLVLIMSVNPGFGGQSFMPASVGRVREAAVLIRRTNPSVALEVDGGIEPSTAGLVVGAGATVLVAGNYIFGHGDIAGSMVRLRAAADGAGSP